MIRRVLAIVLALSLLLSGCSLAKKLVPKNNYHFSEDHDSQSEQENVDMSTSVTNKAELEQLFLTMIQSNQTDASIITDHYDGNLKDDCDAIIHTVLHETPETAYAVRTIFADVKEADMFYKLNLTIFYLNSYSDLHSLKNSNVNSASDMEAALKSALESNEESVLFHVFNYSDTLYETDDYYNTLAQKIFAEDPISVMALPAITSKAYPDSGKDRIVRLDLEYPSAPETSETEENSSTPLTQAELGVMKETVSRFIDSASDYASYASSEKEKAFQIYSYLTGLHQYTIADASSKTPAFDLLTKGIADSRIFALIYNAMCNKAGLKCRVVQGQKDGKEYYWNILEFENYACHLDLLADERKNRSEPRLLFDAQMDDYSWDARSYPKCVEPVPTITPNEKTPEENHAATQPPEEPPNEPPEENNAADAK